MDKRHILTTIAENLRSLLNHSGLTSNELARRCGVSGGTISKIMKGTMSITIPMAITIAEGLEVDIMDLLDGITVKKTREKVKPNTKVQLSIGILSINNKRICCIKDIDGKTIGVSELTGGLDLTETSGNLLHLIIEAIKQASSEDILNQLKQARLNLVTQSFEFEDTRLKFALFAQRHFQQVMLLPDWQVTYLSTFKQKPGISLITDKGVSASYMHEGKLKKLGGWKFPIYDLGGENWLGLEAIRHTIDAAEGYIPMTGLAQTILANFNGKIEKITETCFKKHDYDVYCSFADILLRRYLTDDKTAKTIIKEGFKKIYQSIEQIDNYLGKQVKIVLNGSLAGIYKPFFNKERVVFSSSEADKASLLADLTKDYLLKCGINND